jgi:hypothetical protein
VCSGVSPGLTEKRPVCGRKFAFLFDRRQPGVRGVEDCGQELDAGPTDEVGLLHEDLDGVVDSLVELDLSFRTNLAGRSVD